MMSLPKLIVFLCDNIVNEKVSLLRPRGLYGLTFFVGKRMEEMQQFITNQGQIRWISLLSAKRRRCPKVKRR